LPCYQFLKISRINDLPIFLSAPPLVVGKPVLEAILDLKPLIPNSLFHENENPYFPLKPNISKIYFFVFDNSLKRFFNSVLMDSLKSSMFLIAAALPAYSKITKSFFNRINSNVLTLVLANLHAIVKKFGV
jgi:hypothetical protein